MSAEDGIDCVVPGEVSVRKAYRLCYISIFSSVQFISLSIDPLQGCKPHGYGNSQKVHLYIQSVSDQRNTGPVS